MRRTGLAGGICSRKIKLGSDPALFLSSNHATRRCTNFEGFGHTNSWEIIMGGRIYPDADPQATIVWFLPFSLATTRCTPHLFISVTTLPLCCLILRPLSSTLYTCIGLLRRFKRAYSGPNFAKQSWIVTGLTALVRT